MVEVKTEYFDIKEYVKIEEDSNNSFHGEFENYQGTVKIESPTKYDDYIIFNFPEIEEANIEIKNEQFQNDSSTVIKFECASEEELDVVGDGDESIVHENTKQYKKKTTKLPKRQKVTPSINSDGVIRKKVRRIQPDSIINELRIIEKTNSGEKSYKCSMCDKIFKASGHCNRHIRSHFSDKPFSCDLCDRKLTRYSSLKRHMLTHSGVKPFVCNVCNKKFIQAEHLTSHLLIHEGIKPYECEICEKKFSRAWNRDEHMLTHYEEKPFVCEKCGYGFTRFKYLQLHIKQQCKINKYKCHICNKKFLSQLKFKKHITGNLHEF